MLKTLPVPLHTDINPKLKVAFDEMLSFLSENLNGYFFLEAGTALGFWRNGGPIGHDKDIDFGLLAEYYTPELEEKLLATTKFKSYRRHGSPDFGYETRFVHENGVRVDWFLFYPHTEGDLEIRWAGAFLDGGHPDYSDMFAMPFPAQMMTHLDAYEYDGKNHLPLPSQTEIYLAMRYGEDWRTPNAKWDWRTPLCRDDSFTKKLLEIYVK